MNKSEPLNSIQHKILALLFAGFISMLAINSVFADSLTASIDKSELSLGDSFNLKLSIDSNKSSHSPDLTPLEKDFDVLSTRQASQIKIINGTRSDSFSWLITLAPKHVGKLMIPAVRLGPYSSDPISIDVLKSPPKGKNNTDNAQLSIHVEFEPGAHYIHEEFPMTVTILDGLGIKNASISEYSGENFIVKQSGTDNISQTQLHGRTVTKIERKYLVKSLNSGALTFPPLTLTARVSQSDNRQSLLGNNFSSLFDQLGMSSSLFDDILNPGREIIVRSSPVNLDIKSHPTSTDTWFLPAKQVKLTSSFNSENTDIKIGEAITRTVQIFALGASTEQLPDLQFNTIDGAKIYVDNSEVKSIDTAQGTAAIKEYVTSIIPTRSGEIMIPDIEVKWWNTDTDNEEIATLTNQAFVAKGGEIIGGSAASKQTPSVTNEIQKATDSHLAIDSKTSASKQFIKSGTQDVLIFVACLSLIALLFLILQYKRQQSIQKSAETKYRKDKAGNLYSEIESACLKNDPLQAYAATMKYLKFFQFEYPLTKDVLHELNLIEQSLYSNQQKQDWQGKHLLATVNVLHTMTKKSTPAKQAEKLHPLYPVLNS